MKKIATATATALAAVMMFGTQAQADGHGHAMSPYVYDSQKQVVRDGVKRCLLNGHIKLTPDNATEECNPELIKRVEAPKVKPAPAPAPKPEIKTVTLNADTYFDFDKSNLKPAGKAALDELIKEMGDLTEIAKITVVGHTDSIGTAEYNQGLSERRANTVRDYMIDKGVPAAKIEARGEGEANPIADNSTREGRAKNRRVDVTTEGKIRK
ncbi:MAG: OmpA family protein [Halothiobacillaceae bacterium]